MFDLPEHYVIEKFYEHAGYPHYVSTSSIYEGGCPICREGKSWGKKRRLYYIPKNNIIYCHNCGWSSSPLKWIAEVEGISTFKVIENAKNTEHEFIPKDVEIETDMTNHTLPGDCVNLSDSTQIQFYMNDDIVLKALNYIKERRLDTAVNRPKAFWLCRDQKPHINRIIIPFYDKGEIVHYQSRSFLKDDKMPKYLSKKGSRSAIFNIDNINSNLERIYIFEGPLDSCFVKNGVSLTGIQEKSSKLYNGIQEEQINRFPLYEKIWVLDNQWIDEPAKNKTLRLLKDGHKCFIWPRILKNYKDFNELCIKSKMDSLPTQLVDTCSYKGIEGIMKLNMTS